MAITRRKLFALMTVALFVFGAVLILNRELARRVKVVFRAELHPQTAWVACNRNAGRQAPSTFTPLSDRAAAALVTREPETRPDNDRPFSVDGVRHQAPNVYVPSAAQLRAFLSAKTSHGEAALKFNPYFRYVNGRDGLADPTTDELIQWVAHKWGIPENWLKAEFVQESDWSTYQLGDQETVTRAQYARYPFQSRVPGTLNVYQSLGITQERWAPNGAVGVGSNPLRWESEAFNLDYQASMVRFYYDDPDGARSAWGDRSYAPCEKWNSIGGWFNSYPWRNAGQATYIQDVKHLLADRAWRSSGFLNWTPPSLPPGVELVGAKR